MRVWITKWWRSEGIIEDEVTGTSKPNMVKHIYDYLFLGKDCFQSRGEAERYVGARAKAEVVSLRRRANKIEREWLGK